VEVVSSLRVKATAMAARRDQTTRNMELAMIVGSRKESRWVDEDSFLETGPIVGLIEKQSSRLIVQPCASIVVSTISTLGRVRLPEPLHVEEPIMHKNVHLHGDRRLS
jgi:hypothetical protein